MPSAGWQCLLGMTNSWNISNIVSNPASASFLEFLPTEIRVSMSLYFPRRSTKPTIYSVFVIIWSLRCATSGLIGRIPLEFVIITQNTSNPFPNPFQIKETVKPIRSKRRKSKVRIEMIIFPIWEKIKFATKSEMQTNKRDNHIMLPRNGQRLFVCACLARSTQRNNALVHWSLFKSFLFRAHCVFTFSLLIDRLSIICHYFSKWLLFIVFIDDVKSNYLCICHEKSGGDGFKRVKRWNQWTIERCAKKESIEENEEKTNNLMWLSVIVTRCAKKKSRHEKLRWHVVCDTCRFRRIWRMNHSKIDCFTMQTLIVYGTRHTKTSSARDRAIQAQIISCNFVEQQQYHQKKPKQQTICYFDSGQMIELWFIRCCHRSARKPINQYESSNRFK